MGRESTSPSPDPALSRLRAHTVLLAVLGTVAFAAAYGQAPLFYSNQNQYFLHGLADAGVGHLSEDWLANTLDPTPIFSSLVAVTARYLHPWLFHAYHGLLLAAYAAAMVGLFAFLAGPAKAATRWPIFLALLVLVHSAGARWLSCRMPGLGIDYPWYLQAGVAGQYLLGGMFQPSVFGVLLVVSIGLFVNGRPQLAIVAAIFAATVHSTYVLPAGMLTAGYMTTLILERQWRQAVYLGAMAFVLVLPVAAWTAVTFSPSDMPRFTEAQNILVNLRIPHHCRPDLWLDTTAGVQIAWVVLSLALVWRTRLFPVFTVCTLLAAILTIAQVVTGSNGLALLFPWRISAVLVPIATAIVLAQLVALRLAFLDGMTVRWCSAVVIALLAAAGVSICAMGEAFRTRDEDVPLMEFVRTHRKDGDIYLLPVRIPQLAKTTHGAPSPDFKRPEEKQKDSRLIPPDLQRFRLATGAAIFVDFKAIPYKDYDVLEWHWRLTHAADAQKALLGEHRPETYALIRGWDVTHIVIPAGKELRVRGLTKLPFDDPHYQIYRFDR